MRDRVIRRLRELERSPIEAAENAGLERNFIDDFVNGKKESFTNRHLRKVAAALDWTVSELLDQPPPHLRGVTSGTVVPELDIRAGAAYAGGFSQEEQAIDEYGHSVSRDAVRANWGIPPPFLRDELHIQVGRAHILPIRGDSMVDVLYDGDRVIIDLDDTDVSQGGIFAVLDDNGSVIVKQVELLRGAEPGRVICKSRNAHYEPFELRLTDAVKILGRVAARITRL